MHTAGVSWLKQSLRAHIVVPKEERRTKSRSSHGRSLFLSYDVHLTEGRRQRCYLRKKGVFVIERKPLTEMSYENITQALNELKHEVLSHQLFLSSFSKAVRAGEIKGLTKSSLFRMTLAYFLLVPDAKEKFLRELEKQLKSKRTHSRMPD